MVKLNSTSVFETMKYVTFLSDELNHGLPPADAVWVSGVYLEFAFHSGRLGSVRDEVADLLDGLPDSFHRRNGLGAPMLDGTNAAFSKQQLDCLLALGSALGMVVVSTRETPSQYIHVCVDTDPHVEARSALH